MVTALALLGVLAALFAAAALATREGAGMAPAPPDAPDHGLPPGQLSAADVEQLRFPLAARGYRMAAVDAALERLAAELADRDRRLADLEAPAAEGPSEAEPEAEAEADADAAAPRPLAG